MKKLLTILCLVLLSTYSFSQNIPPDGLYEYFHDNGQLELRGNLKDGEFDGLWEQYYENGQLEFRGNYKEGKREGLWEYFDEEGNLTKTENYKDGVLQE